MAKVTITATKLEQNTFGAVTFTAGSTDGVKIPMSGKDNKIVILAQNSGSSAATVKVKAGNGLQGISDSEVYSVAAGGLAAINLESGVYKFVSGEDKGYALLVPSSADVKFAAVVLP